MSRMRSEWFGSAPPDVVFADVLFRQEPDEDEDEDEEEDDGSGKEDDEDDDNNDEGYSE